MTTMEWFETTVKDATVNAVAAKAGLTQSTLARQLKAGTLSPESVVAIARAYGADVLDALVTCGLITPDDIRKHGVRVALASLLDIEIANELVRRAGLRPDGGVFDAPIQ